MRTARATVFLLVVLTACFGTRPCAAAGRDERLAAARKAFRMSSKPQAAATLMSLLIPEAEARAREGDEARAATLAQEALRALRKAGVSNFWPGVLSLLTHQAKTYAADAQARQRVRLLESQLAKRPDSVALCQGLFRLHLIARDDPVAAQAYLARGGDARAKRLLPLAARRSPPSSRAEAVEIGLWYQDLGRSGTWVARSRMLRRSAGFLLRAWAMSTGRDDLFDKAHRLVLKAQDDLARQRIPLLHARRAVDYLPLCRVGVHVPPRRARWGRDGLTIRCDAGRQEITKAVIPLAPSSSYELCVTFARLGGTGPVALLLPTFQGTVCLVIDAAGTLSVRTFGKPIAPDLRPAPLTLPIVRNKPCTLRFTVTRSHIGDSQMTNMWGEVCRTVAIYVPRIAVSVDGQRAMQVPLPSGGLSAGDWAMDPPTAFGLAVTDGAVLVRHFQVRSLSLEPVMLVPAGEASTPRRAGHQVP